MPCDCSRSLRATRPWVPRRRSPPRRKATRSGQGSADIPGRALPRERRRMLDARPEVPRRGPARQPDGTSQCGGVPAVHHRGETARHLEQGRLGRHHHRDPEAHRLHRGQAESLVVRREDDEGGGGEPLLELVVLQPRPQRDQIADTPGGRSRLHRRTRVRRQPDDHKGRRLGTGVEDGPGVEHEVHVLVHKLAEGQCVPGAVPLRRRPGQHVVDAQRRHRDPA